MKRAFLLFILPLTVHAQLYFTDSYKASRELFQKNLQQLKKNYRKVKSGSYNVPSQTDKNLYSDWYYLPAQKRETPHSLIIITSGVHGVEAFAGTAIQHMFTQSILPKINWENTALLMIHSLNPYGHKHKRRVTENNVDLNRNFLKHENRPEVLNEKYPLFEEFLNPKKPAEASLWQKFCHYSQAVYYVLKHSKADFRQATLQGQYQYPKGIFYGGKNKEPQVKQLTNLIKKFGQRADRIFHIDLHTGYGQKGKLHFFGGSQYDPEVQKALDEVFAGEKVDRGNDEDFYQTRGDFTQYTTSLFPNKLVLAMPFEYGTLDSQTLTGALESLRRIRLENQGQHWGYSSPEDKEIIQQKFLHLFSPPEETWRKKILKRSKEAFSRTIRRFQNLSF